MRSITISASILACAYISTALSAPNPPFHFGPPENDRNPSIRSHPKGQTPMTNPGSGPGPAVPGDRDSNNNDHSGNGGSDTLTISDILPKTRSVNIFASLTRDISSVASRLESLTPASNTTLLAPLNSAMQALPRKPWEDRPGSHPAVSAQSDEDQAAENLKKFVLEHVVPDSPWKEGVENKIQTLGGAEIWWEKRSGGADGKEERRVIMPGEIVVDGVLGRVGNGEIWALKGVVNYR